MHLDNSGEQVVRFTTLLVLTLAATKLLTLALAQQLPQLDVALPGHRIVINSGAVAFESVIGALWVIQVDGTIVPGVFPSDGVPISALGPCSLPQVTIEGIPFVIARNFAPGVLSLTSHNDQLYFSSTCTGGLWRLPIPLLTDPLLSPAQRAKNIIAVSPKPADVVETFEGITANAFDRFDPWIYACDSFHLRIIRIHSQTGIREVVASDPLLFNFPTKAQFLPSVFGLSPLVVASDQEYRLRPINSALTADITQPPWIVTKVLVFGQH
jgi:hypothetical protein